MRSLYHWENYAGNSAFANVIVKFFWFVGLLLPITTEVPFWIGVGELNALELAQLFVKLPSPAYSLSDTAGVRCNSLSAMLSSARRSYLTSVLCRMQENPLAAGDLSRLDLSGSLNSAPQTSYFEDGSRCPIPTNSMSTFKVRYSSFGRWGALLKLSSFWHLKLKTLILLLSLSNLHSEKNTIDCIYFKLNTLLLTLIYVHVTRWRGRHLSTLQHGSFYLLLFLLLNYLCFPNAP